MNLQEALADFKERALSVDLDAKDAQIPRSHRGEERYHGRADHFPGNFVNLRRDWELPLKAFIDYEDISEVRELPDTSAEVLDLMMLQLEGDLSDLIENGDSQGSTDPFLKVIDGEKVRGKKVSRVEIAAGSIYRDLNHCKETLEYTVYVTLYTEFN